MIKTETIHNVVCDYCEGKIEKNSPYFTIRSNSSIIVTLEGVKEMRVVDDLDFCCKRCVRNYFDNVCSHLENNKDKK